MIAGYAIIAIPTGIVSVELASARARRQHAGLSGLRQPSGHDPDARHCKRCGAKL